MGIMQLLMSGGAAGEKKYIDDLFNTDLYSNPAAAPSPKTITNGINFLDEGGLLWVKNSSYSSGGSGRSHVLYSTANNATSSTSDHCLITNSSNKLTDMSTNATVTWNDNGWSVPSGDGDINGGWFGDYASWSFRKSPGFFDIQTWNGDSEISGNDCKQLSHDLECKVGFAIIKCTSADSTDWVVWHKQAGLGQSTMYLNTNGGNTSTNYIFYGGAGSGHAVNSSTQFGNIGPYDFTNETGKAYVAYLFADGDDSDAQIFGGGGNESVVKCGSWDAVSGAATIELGWEPQWVLVKNWTDAGWWLMFDAARGMCVGNDEYLVPNTNGIADSGSDFIEPHPTGFSVTNLGSAQTFIYVAIRRDMKPAEDATKVFSAGTRSGSGSVANTTSTVFTDMSITCRLNSAAEYNGLQSRVLGTHTLKTTGETSYITGLVSAWNVMTGMEITGSNGAANVGDLVDYSFKRQPGFFDVAIYDGDPSNNAKTVYHNLGVKPELIITKCRSNTGEWVVTCPAMSGTISGGSNDGENYDYITGYLSRNNYFSWRTYSVENNMTQDVTATTITYAGNSSGGNADLNYTGRDYVAYLFASKSGISAIGQYTGTGSAVNVDCGFDAAARFILIKRIGLDPVEATGDWYIYDSARGIVSGNDPYYLLNEEAAEVTGTDYIDPYASGFTVTSSAPAALNGTGTYLYLAIA